MLARRMDLLGTESAFEVLARARALEAQGKHMIHLEIGEPDFPTPSHIIQAAEEALQQGHTHYGPTPGDPEVRQRIAEHISSTRGFPVEGTQVVITPGAKPIMFYTLLALAQRGDEVIYPNPGFPIYESMIRFSGAKPVPMRLPEERSYHPDLEDLAGKITSRTRLIILNSPHNPTGAVMDQWELQAIAKMVAGHPNLYILSDEIYSEILYGGVHNSIATLPDMARRTIILDGFSKTFAMTGWRLGYGVFPHELVPGIVRLAVNSVSCATTFVQRAALAALDGPHSPVEEMVDELRQRRDIMVEGLRKIPGLSCPKPDGAFYVFPNIRGTGLTSRQFEDKAMNEAGVALLAGGAFGKYGEGYVRLSYANSQTNIALALERLETMVKKLPRRGKKG